LQKEKLFEARSVEDVPEIKVGKINLDNGACAGYCNVHMHTKIEWQHGRAIVFE
jgi:hypothetical protein